VPLEALAPHDGARETHEILDQQRTAHPAAMHVRRSLSQHAALAVHALIVRVDHTDLGSPGKERHLPRELFGQPYIVGVEERDEVAPAHATPWFLARACPPLF